MQNNPRIFCFGTPLDVFQNISTVLKKIQVIPYLIEKDTELYEELDFLAETLIFIDFKQLPKIKNRVSKDRVDINLIPIYDSSQDVDYFQLDDFNILGQLYLNADFLGQLKLILERYNRYQSTEFERRKLAEETLLRQKKISEYIEKLQGQQKDSFNNQLLIQKISLLMQQSPKQKVLDCLYNLLDDWDEIQNFSILTLSETAHQLKTLSRPALNFSKKWENIPELWLHNPQTHGVSKESFELVKEITTDILGESVTYLQVSLQGHLDPDSIILLKTDSMLGREFDWEKFGLFLNLLFKAERGNHHQSTQTDFELTSWELLDRANQTVLKGINSNQSLLEVNFAPTLHKLHPLDFLWGECFEDLKATLVANLGRLNVYYCYFSPEKYYLVVEQEVCEEVLEKIKLVCLQFPFMRYVHDKMKLNVEMGRPSVKIIPFSPLSILSNSQLHSKGSIKHNHLNT